MTSRDVYRLALSLLYRALVFGVPILTDLRSIKVEGGGGGFYVLRHNAGKIRLLAQFTGFYEVVSRIKAANPQFETVGI